MKVTFLGTGTSGGVPILCCDCAICSSTNPLDKRLRTSVLLEIENTNIIIDTSPDFRQQLLRQNTKKIDAIIFTHEHKDHVGGLDDIRPFNFFNNVTIPLYVSSNVDKAIRQEFHYAFGDTTYPGVPRLNLIHIEPSKPFFVADTAIQVLPIHVMHGTLPILAFRIKDFTYITDAKYITAEDKEKIKGTKTLVVNALRKEEHFSHFNLEEALAFIQEIKPEKAYLTHIGHQLGKHDEISNILPPNVFLAYDTLQIIA